MGKVVPPPQGPPRSWWKKDSALLGQPRSLTWPPKGGLFPGGDQGTAFRLWWRRGSPTLQHPIDRWRRSRRSPQRTGTQEPSGYYFLASVSPVTPEKAPRRLSRHEVKAPPLLGGLCPRQPSRSSPSLPPGSHGPRGGRAGIGGPARPRPRHGPGFPSPVPTGKQPEPRCS